MRNEETMYKLFMDIAKEDDRILAVYMNGSRTNPNVPKDIFQDYDIVFVVSEIKSFIENQKWLKKLGDILYMQYPDENPFYPNNKEQYGLLMQFDDGNRVDLTLEILEYAKENIKSDKLCKVLLDKAGVLPDIPEATDEDYHIKKPSEVQFSACCNEFWWCSNNIAKGLWRNEMPYVQDMTNFVVRKELERMLSWKVGLLTNFTVSVGKSAKYMYKWLDNEEYQKYLKTYFGGNVSEAWDAIEIMCDLFESVAKEIAEEFGYLYNDKEGKAARLFLEHVRNLPSDAKEVCIEKISCK